MAYNESHKKQIIASGENFIITNRGDTATNRLAIAVALPAKEHNIGAAVIGITKPVGSKGAATIDIALSEPHKRSSISYPGYEAVTQFLCDHNIPAGLSPYARASHTSAPFWVKQIEDQLKQVIEQHPEVLEKSSDSIPANKQIQERLLAPIIEELKKHEPAKGRAV